MKVTFDLHQSRWGFISIGLQLIFAGIKGSKSVWFKDIECGSVDTILANNPSHIEE